MPFTSYGLLDEQSIICTAPSKTFNLAGLKTSNVIIPDGAQRARFAATLEHHGIHGANPFGLAATEAAYTHGEPWLATVMAYVGENYRFLAAYVAAHLPQLRVVAPEGTYLVWVDCRGLGLTPAEVEAALHGAGAGLPERGGDVWAGRGRLCTPQYRLPAQHPGRSAGAYSGRAGVRAASIAGENSPPDAWPRSASGTRSHWVFIEGTNFSRALPCVLESPV